MSDHDSADSYHPVLVYRTEDMTDEQAHAIQVYAEKVMEEA